MNLRATPNRRGLFFTGVKSVQLWIGGYHWTRSMEGLTIPPYNATSHNYFVRLFSHIIRDRSSCQDGILSGMELQEIFSRSVRFFSASTLAYISVVEISTWPRISLI